MNNQTRSKIRHDERLLERKAVLTICQEFKEELKQHMDGMEKAIRLDYLEEFMRCSLIPASLGNRKLGGTSSFRHYLKYFKNKYPGVFE